MKNIRNFCIISHIDHGKSTLADRFLELTGSVEKRLMREQVLDSMDLERERGITIKLQPVRMLWRPNLENSSSEFILNLIDTPGHVDFSYEVSRSLAAVEGAILLVDATQGVQAQTIANLELARKNNLVIIPVVNKIDLPQARPEEVAIEIAEVLGCRGEEVVFISAKTGEGVEELLKEIIKRIPPPKPTTTTNARALVFDSFYDDYRGVVVYVRVFDGEIKRTDKIYLVNEKKEAQATEVGAITLGLKPQESIRAGEIGYIVTSFKEVAEARVGETITTESAGVIALPGYLEPMPVVFAELYTTGADDYNKLRDALYKLKLSDAAISFTPTSSTAFGFGFKCGFLGLLHLEIVKERLEREYNLELIVTTPTVEYKKSESALPACNAMRSIAGRYLEPWVKVELILPQTCLGRIIELLESRRGIQKNIRHLETKVLVEYEMPLSEIIVDFYDRVKSATSGYGSLNYELIGWRESDLVELDFLIAGEKIEAFSRRVYRAFAERVAKRAVEKMKEFIPRQNFEVKIQAVVGGKILASERIAPFRKDVTEKLYGGDVTRKKKLLEKQKKGKKKMARMGKVDVPTDVFIKLLKY